MRTTRYALPAQCLIGLFIMVNLSLAQSGDQKIQIQIENDNGASAVMSFGNNPQATYGIDHDLGEMEGPPLSPAFDVRWVNNPGRPDPSYGMGLLYNDYVPCPVNPARADTFVLLVSDGMETSKKWTLSWPDSEYLKTVADSMLLFDPYHREMLVICSARHPMLSSIPKVRSGTESINTGDAPASWPGISARTPRLL